jgi:hypothetical protein
VQYLALGLRVSTCGAFPASTIVVLSNVIRPYSADESGPEPSNYARVKASYFRPVVFAQHLQFARVEKYPRETRRDGRHVPCTLSSGSRWTLLVGRDQDKKSRLQELQLTYRYCTERRNNTPCDPYQPDLGEPVPATRGIAFWLTEEL